MMMMIMMMIDAVDGTSSLQYYCSCLPMNLNFVCLVFIVFHFMDTLVLIVICRDFLCYLVYRPQGCNKLELS